MSLDAWAAGYSLKAVPEHPAQIRSLVLRKLHLIYLWVDVPQIQVSRGGVADVMGTRRTVVQNCGHRKDRRTFLLLSDRKQMFS